MPNAERGCGSGVVYEVNIPNSMYESSVYVSCTCNMTTTCVCMQCGTGGADRAHGGGPRARASHRTHGRSARTPTIWWLGTWAAHGGGEMSEGAAPQGLASVADL
jgi:hypothetical protein